MAKPSSTPLAAALGAGKPRAERPAPVQIAVAGDELERARQTVLLCMDGKAGRGAQTRLRAAELVLGKGLLSSLSDEDLLAEVDRRTRKAKAQ